MAPEALSAAARMSAPFPERIGLSLPLLADLSQIAPRNPRAGRLCSSTLQFQSAVM